MTWKKHVQAKKKDCCSANTLWSYLSRFGIMFGKAFVELERHSFDTYTKTSDFRQSVDYELTFKDRHEANDSERYVEAGKNSK